MSAIRYITAITLVQRLGDVVVVVCSAVCPIIDIIDASNFKYVGSPVCYGGFNWGLHFKWDYPPTDYFKTPQDHIKPLR